MTQTQIIEDTDWHPADTHLQKRTISCRMAEMGFILQIRNPSILNPIRTPMTGFSLRTSDSVLLIHTFHVDSYTPRADGALDLGFGDDFGNGKLSLRLATDPEMYRHLALFYPSFTHGEGCVVELTLERDAQKIERGNVRVTITSFELRAKR